MYNFHQTRWQVGPVPPPPKTAPGGQRQMSPRASSSHRMGTEKERQAGADAGVVRAATERFFVSTTQTTPAALDPWGRSSQSRASSARDFRGQRSGFFFFQPKPDLGGGFGAPFSSFKGGSSWVVPPGCGLRVSGRPPRHFDRRLGCSPSPREESERVTDLEGPFVDSRLAIDSLIQVHGLINNGHHNGKYGHVKGYGEHGTLHFGRYTIKVSTGESMSLNPANVELVAEPHEAWRFKSKLASKPEKPAADAPEEVAAATAPAASTDVAVTKAKTRSALLGGLKSGALEAAVAKMEEDTAEPAPAPAPTPEPEPEPEPEQFGQATKLDAHADTETESRTDVGADEKAEAEAEEASWADAMAELQELAKALDAATLRREVQRLRTAWSD